MDRLSVVVDPLMAHFARMVLSTLDSHSIYHSEDHDT